MLLHARITTRWESFLEEEILAMMRSHRSVPLRWIGSLAPPCPMEGFGEEGNLGEGSVTQECAPPLDG